MLGVVNDNVPEPPESTLPPVALAYQSTAVPATVVADKDTVPANVLEPLTPVGAVGEFAGLQAI